MSIDIRGTSRIVGRLCAAAVGVGAVLSAPIGIPSATAQPCPDIDVTFARGLGQAPGPGEVGQAFFDSFRGLVAPRSVTMYAVNYPATSNFLGVSPGVLDATNHVNYMVANCPATRLVLAGYSEGATVINFLVGGAPAVPAIPALPPIPGIPPIAGLPPIPVPGIPGGVGLDILNGAGPTNPLPPAAFDHVAAVVVFGDPFAKIGGPLNGRDGGYGPKTIDLCHAGDPVCGGGEDMNMHHDYVPGLTDQGAAFAAGRV